MDGGSGLNLLYTRTLDAMGIPRSFIRPSKSPFFGIVPGVQEIPLGQIDLPVTFGDAGNFRTEIVTFEVVDFEGSYHAILGRPCYAKFMVVPNYTYLKFKMLGPGGVITVGSKASRAHECDKENCELAERAVEPRPSCTRLRATWSRLPPTPANLPSLAASSQQRT
jgi:hypothetical protein